jgi:TRAP-type C4-dicarboxylate transport system permease small subunit
MKALHGFVEVWDRFIDVFMVLAGVLFWFQMVIVNVEVFSRYFLRPTTWVAEISSILILWIPFMVAAWVLRKMLT